MLLQSGLSTFSCHTWVRGTFVAVGSVTGQVGVFLRGEQKGCYQLMEHIPVICIAPHQAGFVVLSHAMLSFFAPTEPDRRFAEHPHSCSTWVASTCRITQPKSAPFVLSTLYPRYPQTYT